ncbi:hypothetical protein F4805DRAFT_475015 [Annulohypoxylon moriforme]|nr:hypothetical protein F4805DRAFT_475015 [Annulohypoxylon moriforme]
MSSTAIRETRRQYRRLKRNTQIFKTWLESAAKLCGWEKEGNERERTVSDIATQVELVAANWSETGTMPAPVHAALVDCIKGRKSCKDFFRSSNLSTEESANSHAHFIEILEPATESPSSPPAVSIEDPVQDSEQQWHVVEPKRRRRY